MILFAGFVVTLVLILVLLREPPELSQNTPKDILDFISGTYLLLTTGLLAIWLFGIPLSLDENADPESLTKHRIHGTLAILGMVTVLGIVLSIAWATIEYHKVAVKTVSENCPASCATESTTR